jgi:hypothetical protein
MTSAALLIALEDAWDSAIANGHDLYVPPGTYDVGANNLPFTNPNNTPLLDCLNITIWGAGPLTIFKTSSAAADVFQINACQNLHLRNFMIHPTGSDTSGSNGISITNGWDNITIDGVHVKNAASVDATTFVDGGKALTLQPSTTSNECGYLRANIIATGCSEGFGFEPDLVTSLTKKTAVHVNLIARDCFYGVKAGAAAASGALSTGMTSGITVRGLIVDCQKSVVVSRIHGIDIDVQVVNTKTAAARRLNPSAVAWYAADTIVETLWCQYAHHSLINITGDSGACDYKARIGGASAGSSGLTGATSDCTITLDLGGTAATADILELDSGGNTIVDTNLFVSKRTATTLPDAFYVASLRNNLKIGSLNVGSYTGTLTGCTTSPTGTIEYSVSGDQITLEIPTISGTSNTTAATVTGMPASIRPIAPQVVVGRTTDNGTDAVSLIDIGTNGTLTLYYAASLTFTGSGTKGTKLCTVTYRRS